MSNMNEALFCEELIESIFEKCTDGSEVKKQSSLSNFYVSSSIRNEQPDKSSNHCNTSDDIRRGALIKESKSEDTDNFIGPTKCNMNGIFSDLDEPFNPTLKTNAAIQTSQSLLDNFLLEASCQTSQKLFEGQFNDDQCVPAMNNITGFESSAVKRPSMKRVGLSKKAKYNPLHRFEKTK